MLQSQHVLFPQVCCKNVVFQKKFSLIELIKESGKKYDFTQIVNIFVYNTKA